jgi:hypothetical protein
MKKIIPIVFAVLLLFATKVLAQTDPKLTEVWQPEPKVIQPGKTPQDPSSDAIVLFNGKDFSQWVKGNNEPPGWKLEGDAMTVQKNSGEIKTKRSFGDCQLHIEWKTPAVAVGEGQERGNSGIFLMGRYEVQVLDSYDNRTFSNGQAGSIYKQHIPLVNACRGPGEWQSFDIIFIAPVFKDDGSLQSPGRFTVFQNGVLIHNNVEIKGTTVNEGQPSYKKHNAKEPIRLQDHGEPVSYRNIWVREL